MKIEELKEKIRACHRCRIRNIYNCTPVPGSGNISSKIFFVGESPGADEIVENKPFVGRAGKLLRGILTDLGLSENEYYIGNLINCRPEGNKFPSDWSLVNACLPWLHEQLRIARPKLIVGLGAQTLFYFARQSGISYNHGKFYEVEVPEAEYKGPFISTFHPSFCLRPGMPNSNVPAMRADQAERQKMLRDDLEKALRFFKNIGKESSSSQKTLRRF